MSSIVKKASHFTPKVRKTPQRQKADFPTPPATQKDSSKEPEKATPESESEVKQSFTTHPPKPSFKLTLNGKRSAEVAELDPRDTSAVDLNDKGLEDHENDIFHQRRRSSVRPQRRLSGITHTMPRSRAGSVVSTRASVGGPDEEPFKISVPMLKPTKRRKSSAVAIRAPTAAPVPDADIAEEEEEVAPAPVPATLQEQDVEEPHPEFIVALDVNTNKLRKFRKRTDENKNENPPVVPNRPRLQKKYKSSAKRTKALKRLDDYEKARDALKAYIPVAPEILIRQITSVDQIPKNIPEDEVELYKNIKFDSEISMADLCKPNFKIGDISNEFKRAEEGRLEIEKRKRKRKDIRMIARVDRTSLEQAIRKNENPEDLAAQQLKKEQGEQKVKAMLEGYSEADKTLQLMIVNGTLEVDPESQVVDRHSKQVDRSHEAQEENPYADPITSSTYSQRRHTEKWTGDEMVTFYNALSTWGTDFLFIAQLFPYRTRKQIKLKFNLEEKRFPEIVEMALKRKLPPDFNQYCKASGTDIKTMDFYENELKTLRQEHEQHIREINEEKEKAHQDDLRARRDREIEKRTGTKPLTKAESRQRFRANETVVGSLEDIKKEKKEELKR